LKKFLVTTTVIIFATIFIWSDNSFFVSVRKVSAQTVISDSEKRIVVSLDNQNLVYFEGSKVIGEVKISGGLRATPTPKGEFEVLKKKPLVNYIGPGYNFPNTKWNLMFKPGVSGNYYIHGTYWHNNFGHPMSHGCVNVSYADMEALYNWAEDGTKVTVQDAAERHARGSVVVSEGTVYYLGEEIRYAFPSDEIFLSWGHDFKEVKNANLTDLSMPLGPIVELNPNVSVSGG
jgi:hypothetical protein